MSEDQPAKVVDALPQPDKLENITHPESTATALADTALDLQVPERWDKGKAETIAAAMPLATVQMGRGASETSTIKEELLNSQKDKNEMTKGAHATLEDPNSSQDQKDYAQFEIDRWDKYEQTNFEWRTSPFVEYYDLNPSKFAAMPTMQFLEEAKTFEALSASIAKHEYELELISRRVKDLEQNNAEGTDVFKFTPKQLTERAVTTYQSADQWNIDEYISKYAEENPQFNGSKTLWDVMEAQFNEIQENAYDKSPREINDANLALTKKVVALTEQSLASVRAKKQAAEEAAKPPVDQAAVDSTAPLAMAVEATEES